MFQQLDAKVLIVTKNVTQNDYYIAEQHVNGRLWVTENDPYCYFRVAYKRRHLTLNERKWIKYARLHRWRNLNEKSSQNTHLDERDALLDGHFGFRGRLRVLGLLKWTVFLTFFLRCWNVPFATAFLAFRALSVAGLPPKTTLEETLNKLEQTLKTIVMFIKAQQRILWRQQFVNFALTCRHYCYYLNCEFDVSMDMSLVDHQHSAPGVLAIEH